MHTGGLPGPTTAHRTLRGTSLRGAGGGPLEKPSRATIPSGPPRGGPGRGDARRLLITHVTLRGGFPAAPRGRHGGRYASILETIGNTPVVRINRLAPPGVNLFVKVEAFNPLGSVKDRLAIAVIEAAEQSGEL